MSYSQVIKGSFLALLVIIATLSLWIFSCGDNLVAVISELASGSSIPSEIWTSGWLPYFVWLIVALIVSFLCGLFCYVAVQKIRMRVFWYALLQSGLAICLCVIAFFIGFEPLYRSSGQIIIMAIGFGVFIPWLSQKQLRQYS